MVFQKFGMISDTMTFLKVMDNKISAYLEKTEHVWTKFLRPHNHTTVTHQAVGTESGREFRRSRIELR